MVAVESVSNSVAILGLHLFPIVEQAIHRDSAGTIGLWRRTDAFESAHPACQLVVIIIAMASAHRLAIPAVFLDVIIYSPTARIVAVLVGVAAPLSVTAGDPF